MAQYLVTGGAGFIGSAVVRAMADRGDSVRVLDDLSTGHRENLPENDPRITFVQGDLADPRVVRPLAEGVQAIVHLGAVPSVPRSVADPLTSDHTNIHGTLNVFLSARDASVSRVVYASSSSVYGYSEHLPLTEDLPLQPRSPYAVTKATNELYASVCSSLYGMDCVGLRFFNVFGPRQDPNSAYAAVIAAFIQRMRRGQVPHIHGDGLQARDFTYVDNVVHGILTVCDAPAPLAGVYNLACGAMTSLLELVEQLNVLLGTQHVPEHGEARAGDIRNSWADVSKARTAFGYAPAVDLVEGLRRTVAWYESLEDNL